ncbi:hypothetical protein [Cellulomonas sp. PhB150]|uniref:hypothetical protein n=1 Tax=Cellulomonas sp. PhB150 TaxID=2485188 RepID=UPI000FB04562|nr:hypothetical protein [Cellulomonas sp. PhB150]ROS23757.1 hypothetical protein EDF34_2817 [Cellulomonas sp. PhB150]
MPDAAASERGARIGAREVVVVVLLSVTTIVTAWVGFQASKWGGAMSISFSQASSARIEASRQEGVANRKLNLQATLFAQWAAAYSADDEELADFLQDRFPEPLATAFPVWLDSKPLQNPAAAASPFDLPEYRIPELALAQAADARADAKFAEALKDNQRGDNYTVLTVAFAAVLFFAAMSGRMSSRRAGDVLLGLGLVLFVIAASLLIAYPKLV